MDLRAYQKERAVLVDRYLDASLPRAEEPPGELHAAMRHMLFPGGKRLRPVLACAAAEAAGAAAEVALPIAGAVELVHTYSLIHDDLPCMDDDALRRGRPTVHVVYGEALAVLSGDALLAAAFELLARAATQGALQALAELAAAAGSKALVGGQAADLACVSEAISAAGVEEVHRRKTAALFRAAAVGGGYLAGADEETLKRLRRYGEAVGLGFQIADDLEDGDAGCSLPRAIGEAPARQRAEEFLEVALRELDEFGERAEPLRELARYAIRRQL